MASAGPNSPGTLANVTYSGFAWSNASNAAASDNSYATAMVSGQTDYLRATNFGFSIPSGATIDGIVVEVERKASSDYSTLDGSNADSIKLVKAGAAAGSSKRDGSNYWPTSDTYKSYGGASDKWGTTWTDSDINNSGFGFQMEALNYSKSSSTASVDHIRITVYYTEGGGGASAVPVIMNQYRQRRA